MTNRQISADNLTEAIEQLNQTLNDLNSNEDYSEVELRIDLEHAYHHLNFAWNTRNVDEDRVVQCSSQDFQKWSKYPINDIHEYDSQF
jgi:hypothetical protein